jgi:DNA-binding NarL/FixJ family response regulator
MASSNSRSVSSRPSPRSEASTLAFAELLVRADEPEELWNALVEGLSSLFANHFIVATFHFRDDWPAAIWRSQPAQEQSAEWWARNWSLHPGLPWLMANPGVAIGTVSDVLSEDALSAHPYYREFMEPEGWRYSLAWFLWTKTGIGGFIGVNRRPEQGDFTRAERDLASSLHGLMAGAYERIARRVRLNDTRNAFEDLLGRLPVAVLLYAAREGRVVFANRACREALAHWRGETALKRGPVTAKSLPEEIQRACVDAKLDSIEVRHPGGDELRAIVHGVDNSAALFAERVVQVIIEERKRPRASAAWVTRTRLLSVSEQEVAKLAAWGLSNAQIGALLKKSAHTVKKQLEVSYGKLRIAGRGQLASLYADGRPARRSQR